MLQKALVFIGFLLIYLDRCGQHDIYVPELSPIRYELHGHFNLGVLLPVHLWQSGQLCSDEVHNLGLLQRIEALAYAVNEINENRQILPSYKIGFVMFDDCYTDMTALAHSMHFVRTSRACELNNYDGCGFLSQRADSCIDIVHHYSVTAVLGSESSIPTVHLANMMSIFKIPHISYMATSPRLSNKNKYPEFIRMVPSDYIQVDAIVKMLYYFDWTYVNVLYAEGEYGEQAVKALYKRTENTNICFNMVVELGEDMEFFDYRNLVRDIINNEAVNVSVVIVFSPSIQGKHLLRAAASMPMAKGRITWIAGNNWVNHIEELDKGMQSEALGMLSISFGSTHIPKFDDYFQNITAESALYLNPWFDEFFKTYHDCTISNNTFMGREKKKCDEKLLISNHSRYTPDRMTSLVFDAIYTYALALDKILNSYCSSADNDEVHSCVQSFLGETLRDTDIITPYGSHIKLDSYGDRTPARYIISNVQKINSYDYELVHIASYEHQNRSLIFTGHEIQWTSGSEKPDSVCSPPCASDEGIVYQQKRCCWTCEKCRDNQILFRFQSNSERWFCIDCAEDTWPNQSNRTVCIPIEPRWLSINDPLGLVMVVLTSVGIIICSGVLILFTLHTDHILVKASSRELMYLMLAGQMICYSFVYTFMIKPTAAVCMVKMTGVSVSFTLIYSPMTVKTIRIYRIFESGKRMNRRLRFVSFRSQLAIAIAIVLAHVSINDKATLILVDDILTIFYFKAVMMGVWLNFDQPKVSKISPEPGCQEIICDFPLPVFIGSIVFNGILLILCAAFAFMTRKLPDNFNESRFIAFCVYSTIIIWVSILPAYFTSSTSTLRVCLLSTILILNATVPLLIIFMPKLYAIYYVSTESLNVKKIASSKNSRCPDFLDNVAPDLVSSSSVISPNRIILPSSKCTMTSKRFGYEGNKIVPIEQAAEEAIEGTKKYEQ